jgi:hypothetical protein
MQSSRELNLSNARELPVALVAANHFWRPVLVSLMKFQDGCKVCQLCKYYIMVEKHHCRQQ